MDEYKIIQRVSTVTSFHSQLHPMPDLTRLTVDARHALLSQGLLNDNIDANDGRDQTKASL